MNPSSALSFTRSPEGNLTHRKGAGRLARRDFHQLAFALNLGLIAVAFFYLLSGYFYSKSAEKIIARLQSMDQLLSSYIHPAQQVVLRPKDILTGGYFEFFVPAVGTALVLWVVIKMLSRTRLAENMLGSVAGLSAIGAAPAWFLLASSMAEHAIWFPLHTIALYELLIALVGAALYLRHRRQLSALVTVSLLLAHYAFWFYEFRPLFSQLASGWGGAVAFTVVTSLLSGLAWMAYVFVSPAESQHI